MKIIVHESSQALAARAAELIARAVAAKRDLVLGLPAGRTPILVYRELVKLSVQRTLDWSGVRAFNLDEFAGSPGAARRRRKVSMTTSQYRMSASANRRSRRRIG